MMYYEKALMALANNNREDYFKNLNEGLKDNEIYCYYLCYSDDFTKDNYKALMDKNDNYSYAVRCKLAIDKGNIKKAIEYAKLSDTGIAYYDLSRYYRSIESDVDEERMLEEACKRGLVIAYDKYALLYRFGLLLSNLNEFVVDIITKAFEAKFVNGYYAYAKLFEEGKYVKKDLYKAIDIYNEFINERPNEEYPIGLKLLGIYEQLNDYNKMYVICKDLLKENYGGFVVYRYLAYIHGLKGSSYYDLTKCMIYNKALIAQNKGADPCYKLALIYKDKIKDIYMAKKYAKKFENYLLDYDISDSNYDLEKIVDIDRTRATLDKTEYFVLGSQLLLEKKNFEAFNMFVKGFLLDQFDCYTQLKNCYQYGIGVEKDLQIAAALDIIMETDLLFQKKKKR